MTAPTPTSAGYYPGWTVVAVAFLVALFSWGFGFYGASIYVVELTGRNGWPTATVSTAITGYYLLSALITTRTADLIARFGPRLIVAGAVLLTAPGVLATIYVTEPWQFYLALVPMAVGWSFSSSAAINAFLAPWFERRRGLAISMALNGASAGGLILLPVWVVLAQRLGYATATWTLMGGMLALLLPLIALYLHDGPARLGLHADNAAAAPPVAARPTPALTFKDILRTWWFWTVVGPFALGLFAQVGFLTHALAFLTPGLGPEGAALAVGLASGAALGGRVLTGLVIDRLDRRRTAAANFVMQIAALALLYGYREPWALYLGAIVFGAGVGNMITFPGLIIQREFAAADFGRVVSLQVAITQFTFAFGPGAMGLLHTFTGDYAMPLVMCGAVMTVATATVLIGPRTGRGP
ncbi:MAG: MFS transporter [Alphaproteobacteria bacterium]